MRRVRCGECTCVHNDGTCRADTIQVRAYDNQKPCCSTYQSENLERAGQRTAAPQQNGYAETGSLLGDYIVRESASRQSTVAGQVVCSAEQCHYNKDGVCRAPYLTIGMPKEEDQIDTACKTYVPT